MKYLESVVQKITKAGFSLGWVSALDNYGRTVWTVDAHRDDGRRFIVHADEKLSAFVELERQVLTVTFYLESIRDGDALGGIELAILRCFFKSASIQQETDCKLAGGCF